MTGETLRKVIAAELGVAAPAGAQALAQELAHRGGGACAAVLYYGSTLRDGSEEGILDFYVLLDNVHAWPGSLLTRSLNRLLPPNVGFLEMAVDGAMLRAKYAVMSLQQFAARVSPAAFDTTIWARFCQPSLCIWSRSQADRENAAGLVASAVVAAASWAARLGPATGSAEDYWGSLFAHTYAAELRVERTSRPRDIAARNSSRYAQLLPLAWQAAGVSFTADSNGLLSPSLDANAGARARRQWARRERWGPRLNILRLLKAALTFEGALDYVAWKIERHRGVRIETTDWQRRHPLLAAPGLYWRLRRQGILRK